jgi:hypothetical protein
MTSSKAPVGAHRAVAGRVLAVAAAVYFVAGGLLTLWFPNDGLDLYVSYVAGTASLHGDDAYTREAYLRAWDALVTPSALASTRDFKFAYPPAWMPVAVALAFFPWGAAVAVWKAVNVAALVGSLMLTERILALRVRDRLAVWTFALVLSPTISVVALGQSSLVILFFVLAAARAAERRRPLLASVALAFAMMKPQLALPLAILLVLRGELRIVGMAAAWTVAFSALGLLLAHSDLASYLEAVRGYAEGNRPDSHIGVGVASLLAHFSAVEDGPATAAGMLTGVAVVAFAAFAPRPDGRRPAFADVVPVALYAAPLGFHCHAYDLVALVPLWAWSHGLTTSPALGGAIRAVVLPLIVPRSALRIVWATLAAGLVSEPTYRIVEYSFRSGILVLLLPLVLASVRARPVDGWPP